MDEITAITVTNYVQSLPVSPLRSTAGVRPYEAWELPPAAGEAEGAPPALATPSV